MVLVVNISLEELEESSRLKEKACENCMGKLKGTVQRKKCSSSGKRSIRPQRGIYSVRREAPLKQVKGTKCITVDELECSGEN